MKKNKKIIKQSIIIGILSLVAIFCVIWFVNNADRIGEFVNGANLYTHAQLESEKKKSYEEGVGDKHQLEHEKAILEELNRILNGQNSEKDKTIAEMQEIIEYYANNSGKFTICFVVDDVTYNLQLAASGEHATAPVPPEKYSCTFLGWSIDGTTIVDVAATQLTQNTTFIAVFDPWLVIFSGSKVLKTPGDDNTGGATVLVYLNSDGSISDYPNVDVYSATFFKFTVLVETPSTSKTITVEFKHLNYTQYQEVIVGEHTIRLNMSSSSGRQFSVYSMPIDKSIGVTLLEAKITFL